MDKAMEALPKVIPKAATAAAVTAATALLGKALDEKYNIREDLAQIRTARQQKRYWKELCKAHGEDDWSFYHTLHSFGQDEYEEAFLFEDRSWTYAEFRGEIGRLAEEFERRGIRNRTVVGMFINNSPEFVFVWWALFKIGAIPAPINTSISQEPFRHCLKISESQVLICSYELYDTAAISLDIGKESATNFRDDRVPHLQEIILYDYGTYSHVNSSAARPRLVSTIIHDELPSATRAMASWESEKRPKVRISDTSQYLFTSGTTGLPKAAIWPCGHAMMGTSPYRWPHMFKKKRRTYLCTPMFHGGAAYALLPATHASGGTIILARKFSVKSFWKDIRRTRANMIFYIGEMVRYLYQAPPDPHHPDESKANGLEIIYGLGINPTAWRGFRNRFGVPWITEYYGATEGTTAISNSNFSNKKGVSKVAHWGPLMRNSWLGQDTFYIIKIDLETGEPVRDAKTGFCRKTEYGEIGEAINRIVPPLQRRHDYVGEGGAEATEKKTLRDVFKKGDLFWRMGDALSMDREGYITFHDRLGDTYRAKGHNISTAEVEHAISSHPNIESANVYAIAMNQFGYEGQLGCAALTMKDGSLGAEIETLKTLEEHLTKTAGLAGYAVPRFARVIVDGGDENKRAQLGIADRESVGAEYVSLMLKKLKTGLRKEGCRSGIELLKSQTWLTLYRLYDSTRQ
ncbi:hypothetical protein, variant [Verruconis gallopava]|uniref:Uncharacterized protein n=1 Tax=Verruconis gallopava TaxID=253628 RepID=A0A0D2A153_9PEZI|nr:hypothetical protein, variant [Verruconis gallopava]KIW00403.1 hypothetical protein, variant [Verruconis gallopava]